MIAFSCSKCGKQLGVKPEFAGRSTACPTCKQPLVVPIPVATPAGATLVSPGPAAGALDQDRVGLGPGRSDDGWYGQL